MSNTINRIDAENLCKKLAQDTMLTKKDELGNDIDFERKRILTNL